MTATTAAEVTAATTRDETPLYLQAADEHVFGILTRPVGRANGVGVICLHAGAQNLSSHRHGVWTRLSRQLAGRGFLTFRMDYHGSGDSSGILVDRSVAGQTMADVDAAVQLLLSEGAERVAVVATCWGGLVALRAAAELEAISSACLIAPPLRLVETGSDVMKGRERNLPPGRALAQFLDPRVVRLLITEGRYRTWVVQRALRRIRRTRAEGSSSPALPDSAARPAAPGLFSALSARQVPIHVLFGEHDRTYQDLQSPGTLPTIEAADILDIVVSPVNVHGLTTLQAQDLVVEHVLGWMAADYPENATV